MDARDSSSGLDSHGNTEWVPGGSLTRPGGVVGSQMSDSHLDGVSGQAPTRGEHQHVVSLTDRMNLTATVGPVGQVMEKRKRGRPPKGLTPKPPPPKRIKEEEEEDVCFICFDGGHLVLCDHKGCPKAYHPTCIKRDESFFQSNSKWNCGWHICRNCLKTAHYKCYTCTNSLCKKCTKDTEYVSVRENNGFCATCMKTIMLIEDEDGENKAKVDFDDRSSWEYLFKVYWLMLKEKLALTLSELKQARNPGNGVYRVTPNLLKSYEHSEVKIVKEEIQLPAQNSLDSENPSYNWASKELLEFVAHIKKGDTSVLSHFDVQALLMEYIKTNNLCDPRHKSQIICDVRLEKLFGKPCVGHIEMLKLLEYHFPMKDDTTLKKSLITCGIVGSPVCADQHSPVLNQSRRLKSRSRREGRTPQINMNDYAAIDPHNINLVFLRRSKMENLILDVEKFHDKVVGSIVRIRVSTSDQKHDMFRLVQVVGTGKGEMPYKLGDKTIDILVDVLNLNKKETMSIDAISDQDFSEEECKRLRQSIRFGLVKQFRVGEIQKKAIALQAEKLDDWLAAEISRLSYLQDQANEKGRKKEVREYTEKLQVLKTPEERQRRLCQYPEVHADPTMHPDYESDNDAAGEDDVSRLRYPKFNINGNHSVYPRREVKDNEPISSQQSQEKSNGGRSNICVQENHDTTGSVPAAVAFDPPCINNNNTSEMENIWSYRDPCGKIQGPFSLVQLRKWSSAGYFPTDMSIWNVNEHDRCSILLNDAFTGSISLQSGEVGNAVDNIVQKSIPVNLDLNGQDSFTASEQNKEPIMDIRPAEDQGSVSIDIHGKAIGIPDLPYTLLNPLNPTDKDVLPKPSSDFANERSRIAAEDLRWTGSSSNTIPTPNVALNWHSMSEPIEFSTLGEESVSDLLAEYDAMESLGSPTSAARCIGDIIIDRNDCFSSIEDLSPTRDAAVVSTVKSEALSSNSDIPFPSLAAVMDDLFGTPDTADVVAFDPLLKLSIGHSTTSSEGETKSADSDIHPKVLPCTTMMTQVMVSTDMDWSGHNPAALMDPNFNVVGWNNSPHNRYGAGDRFGVSRDWELGFGGGERGYSTSLRVCKFYESGHCRKGASCDYLHPS